MSTSELPLTAGGALSVWKMNPAKGSMLNLECSLSRPVFQE